MHPNKPERRSSMWMFHCLRRWRWTKSWQNWLSLHHMILEKHVYFVREIGNVVVLTCSSVQSNRTSTLFYKHLKILQGVMYQLLSWQPAQKSSSKWSTVGLRRRPQVFQTMENVNGFSCFLFSYSSFIPSLLLKQKKLIQISNSRPFRGIIHKPVFHYFITHKETLEVKDCWYLYWSIHYLYVYLSVWKHF